MQFPGHFDPLSPSSALAIANCYLAGPCSSAASGATLEDIGVGWTEPEPEPEPENQLENQPENQPMDEQPRDQAHGVVPAVAGLLCLLVGVFCLVVGANLSGKYATLLRRNKVGAADSELKIGNQSANPTFDPPV